MMLAQRTDMPTQRMGLPRAKRVWYTMETEDGEFMMIEGDVLHVNVESEQDFFEVQIDSQIAPIRMQRSGGSRTLMHVEFNGGFRLHKIDSEPSLFKIARGESAHVAETVKSEDITPEIKRRFKLE
jgi:hypothetical protein